ncbi:endonuclease/exonuclease/phosphatase family protein [Marinomonas sp. C2222]|uniref:Endonuclease/exonuclease/phosphatase family protein n=1 Tax=Marinomonas sargassi TaxID=2984494 RepID=A0ABT2YTC0_9GAMM|nr:endonuclease/exonuclease/phosphatase family protein [Marinomonas sargassi]MCV2403149.1 endonuclease/exonuclease/phosphatase family protein [Marinomonas sargassi]
MLAILIASTLFVLLVTLLPLLRLSHWVIRGMDFPRLQFTAVSSVLLVAQLLLLDDEWLITPILIVITALCLMWQLFWILPYTFFWSKEVKTSINHNTDNQISVLTSNVLTTNRNSEALIELVKHHQPDVLVTLESDKWWEEKLEVLEAEMPYTIKCPLDNLYGMHVFSRLPLDDQEISYLVEDDVPSIHTTLELRTGDKVRALFLHPAPPSPTENPESIQRDAELVIVARSVAESDLPVIVTGDLNDVAWSATTRLFRKMSGLLDPRVGRGIFNTFHADYPIVRWPLDHLFHSKHFTLQDIKRLPSIGSDHFPLLTRLSFTPSKGKEQTGIEACVSDKEWASEIAEKQQVSKSDVPTPGE